MELWIVGQLRTVGAWDFQGVFDSEERAVAACRDEKYFVAPATLNAELPHESHEFPGGYYPLANDGGSGDCE